MEKVIRDGKVAVLYSPGLGAGWYSWNDSQDCLFHPEIVALVEADKRNEITQKLCDRLFGKTFCSVGAMDLKIAWLPVGTAFSIEEFDGAESIMTVDDLPFNA